MDDILIFDYDFHTEYNKIHPDCLQLSKASNSDDIADFFYISFRILYNNIYLYLYNKRNSFFIFFYKKYVSLVFKFA